MKSPNYDLTITIDLLNQRIKEIEKLLRENTESENLIMEKNSHKQSVKYLQFCERNAIDANAQVVDLSEIQGHGFSEFRLMIDNEIDDPQHWQEVKEIAGKEARFYVGDKILKI